MEQILSTLGLALRAGSVAVGEEPVGSAARAKHARLILVASDAAPGSVRRAFAFAQTGACLCLVIPAEKAALGRALRAHELRHVRRDGYRLCRRAWQKARRARPGALRRGLRAAGDQGAARRAAREEQQRHEKNVREGRRRKAPPPKKPDAPPSREPKRAARPKTGVSGGKSARRTSPARRQTPPGRKARPALGRQPPGEEGEGLRPGR